MKVAILTDFIFSYVVVLAPTNTLLNTKKANAKSNKMYTILDIEVKNI